LTGRNPLASLEAWRVASPTTAAKTKAEFINFMWNDISAVELRQLMDEMEANGPELDLAALDHWLEMQFS